jgi:hypothetical protein
MFENKDVVELAPQDTAESRAKRGSSPSKMVATLAGSVAVAGGLLVGNLLISDQNAESGQKLPASNDQAFADSLPTSNPTTKAQASLVRPVGQKQSSKPLSDAVKSTSAPELPKALEQVSKVDLGSVDFSNSTNATQSSGSYTGAGNTTNSTQVSGGSHGESGEGSRGGSDDNHDHHVGQDH